MIELRSPDAHGVAAWSVVPSESTPLTEEQWQRVRDVGWQTPFACPIIEAVLEAVRPFQAGDRVEYGASVYEIRYVEARPGFSTQYVCLITEGPILSDASGLQVFWDDQFRDAKRVSYG